MNKQNNILIGIVLLVILLGGFYFFSRQNDPTVLVVDETPVSTEELVVEETTDSMEEDTADVKVFEVRGSGFSFTPNEIVVNKGDTVRIQFVNDGGMHDWVLDEFDAQTDIIQTGETAEVEFVADTAGIFEFYCSVMNHREMGMVGTFIVQDIEQ